MPTTVTEEEIVPSVSGYRLPTATDFSQQQHTHVKIELLRKTLRRDARIKESF